MGGGLGGGSGGVDGWRGFSPTFFVSKKSLRFIPLILHSVPTPPSLQTSLALKKKRNGNMQKLGGNTTVSVVMLVVCQQVNTDDRNKGCWRERRGQEEEEGGRVVAGGWLVFLRLRRTGCWCSVDLAQEFQYGVAVCPPARVPSAESVRQSQRLGSHTDTALPASQYPAIGCSPTT